MNFAKIQEAAPRNIFHHLLLRSARAEDAFFQLAAALGRSPAHLVDGADRLRRVVRGGAHLHREVVVGLLRGGAGTLGQLRRRDPRGSDFAT